MTHATFLTPIFVVFILVVSLLTLNTFELPKMSGDIRSLYPRSSKAVEDLRFIESSFQNNLVDVLLVPLPSPITEEARMELLTRPSHRIPQAPYEKVG